MQTIRTKKRYYTIGELMELSGLLRSTIEHYTNLGLIRYHGKNKSGHRMYDEDTPERLERIKLLKEQNPKLSLIEIKDILDNHLPL